MFPELDSPEARLHCLAVIRPALLLAPANYLGDVRERLDAYGIQDAVASHDTAVLFDWFVELLARQGVSNHAAEVFIARNGSSRWSDFTRRLARRERCPRLTSYWSFSDCGFRRSSQTCNTPHHRVGCTVPTIPARKGALAVAATGLALFIRDLCNGDLVGWIDTRLADADPGHGAVDRARRMRAALLDPLANIPGTGSKVWSMILAELLLGADHERERWVTTGASFVAVDTLTHNYLHRTGILSRLDSTHAYGPACHAPGGCADVIAALAARIDAREFNPSNPRVFPRFVQFGIWQFCAEGGWAICNANKIDDSAGCKQRFCPAFTRCAKMAIKPKS